jgi:hypothetical protein
MVEEDIACDFRSEGVDRTAGESLHRSRREQRWEAFSQAAPDGRQDEENHRDD